MRVEQEQAQAPEATAGQQKTSRAPVEGFLSESGLLTRVPVSRRTLINWREQGKIPYVKIGRRVLYKWATVEAALLRLQKGGV